MPFPPYAERRQISCPYSSLYLSFTGYSRIHYLANRRRFKNAQERRDIAIRETQSSSKEKPIRSCGKAEKG
jgi:hypothetical protein